MHLQPRHQRGVLPKIVDRHSVPECSRGHRPQHLERSDRRARQRRPAELPAGTLELHGPRPLAFFETRRLPPSRLPARIVVFATEDVGERHRTGRHAPLVVRANGLRRAVCIFKPELGDGGQRTWGADKLHVAALLHIVHAAGEKESGGIGAGMQQRGDVKRVVQARLFVIGPARCELPVAGPRAIERQLVLAEPADLGQRTAQSRPHGEFMAQQQGGIGPWIRPRHAESVGQRGGRPWRPLPAVAGRHRGADRDIAPARDHLDLAEGQASPVLLDPQPGGGQAQVARNNASRGHLDADCPPVGIVFFAAIKDNPALAEDRIVGGLESEAPRKAGCLDHGVADGVQPHRLKRPGHAKIKLHPLSGAGVTGFL